MKYQKAMFWLLVTIGLAGALGCLAMTVSAVQFSQWGRVLFYGLGAVLSVVLLVYCYLEMRKE